MLNSGNRLVLLPPDVSEWRVQRTQTGRKKVSVAAGQNRRTGVVASKQNKATDEQQASKNRALPRGLKKAMRGGEGGGQARQPIYIGLVVLSFKHGFRPFVLTNFAPLDTHLVAQFHLPPSAAIHTFKMLT